MIGGIKESEGDGVLLPRHNRDVHLPKQAFWKRFVSDKKLAY